MRQEPRRRGCDRRAQERQPGFVQPPTRDAPSGGRDQRLASRLEDIDLLPIASRIRCRLRLEAQSPKQLHDCLTHLLKAAGNPKLLTPTLASTLCEHAAGNLRLLMNLANDLLAAACQQERELIDEKLYFEIISLDPKPKKS